MGCNQVRVTESDSMSLHPAPVLKVQAVLAKNYNWADRERSADPVQEAASVLHLLRRRHHPESRQIPNSDQAPARAMDQEKGVFPARARRYLAPVLDREGSESPG